MVVKDKSSFLEYAKDISNSDGDLKLVEELRRDVKNLRNNATIIANYDREAADQYLALAETYEGAARQHEKMVAYFRAKLGGVK